MTKAEAYRRGSSIAQASDRSILAVSLKEILVGGFLLGHSRQVIHEGQVRLSRKQKQKQVATPRYVADKNRRGEREESNSYDLGLTFSEPGRKHFIGDLKQIWIRPNAD